MSVCFWRVPIAVAPFGWTLFGELSVSLDVCVCYGQDLVIKLISTIRLQNEPPNQMFLITSVFAQTHCLVSHAPGPFFGPVDSVNFFLHCVLKKQGFKTNPGGQSLRERLHFF